MARPRGVERSAQGVTTTSLPPGVLPSRRSTSAIYRKVLPELAARGLRGVAFDFPGLGLAERPEAFDYSWSGLSGWTNGAIDALGLDRFHLVVHDVGGPVGFDLVARIPNA